MCGSAFQLTGLAYQLFGSSPMYCAVYCIAAQASPFSFRPKVIILASLTSNAPHMIPPAPTRSPAMSAPAPTRSEADHKNRKADQNNLTPYQDKPRVPSKPPYVDLRLGYSTIQFSIIQYGTAQYSTVQCSTIKCSTEQ